MIVVGAGPAGSVAAAAAARAGASVLLLDRRRVVGEPVRCGELIRKHSLEEFVPGEGPWVVRAFDAYDLATPGGNRVRFHERGVGLLLDRRIFDKELARRAQEAGAELWTSANVTGLLRSGDAVAGVVVEREGAAPAQVRARVVVAADGVASRIARLAGIDTSLGLGEMAATVSAVVEHDDASAACELHFGRLAPGGYAWVFPRGATEANVGLGVAARMAGGQSAAELLRRFLARRFERPRLAGVVAGGIPIARPAARFCWPGLFLAGDAARQVNPLTGAGIYTAMAAGALAGSAAAQVAGGGSEADARDLYEGSWTRRFGAFVQASLEARRQLDGVEDRDLDAAAGRLGGARPHQSVAHSIMELAGAAEAIRRDRSPAPVGAYS